MAENLYDTAQTLLECVSDALSLALRPVMEAYQTMGVPVIFQCCDDLSADPLANGELSVHFRRLFDADSKTLNEVQRVRPCHGGHTAAIYRLVLARCRPTIDEHGELPLIDERVEAAMDLQEDLELVWQALACCTGLLLKIDDLSVDLNPSGNCSLLYADVTVLVSVPALPSDESG